MSTLAKLQTEPDHRSFVVWFDAAGDPYAVFYRNDTYSGDWPGHWWNTDQYDEGDARDGVSWDVLCQEMDGFDGPYLLTLAADSAGTPA